MKYIYFVFFWVLITSSLIAQDNVFVLVDVSKSVHQSELNDAKQALMEVLTGESLSKAFIAPGMGNQSDLVNYKLDNGDKVSVSTFGNLLTSLAINPNPITIYNIKNDVDKVLNSILWIPSDQQTYLTLAKAKIAEYAKNNNIKNYKLYIISDNVNDNYGSGGKPNYPDDYTRNLAEGYNTSTNPVSESGYTKLKFSPSSLFTLSFSPSVDVTKYSLPGANSVVIDDTPQQAEINIISPTKTIKGNELVINSNILNITWSCSNCPIGIKYAVLVSQYDGGTYKISKKDLTSNTTSFELPGGKYKITVSSTNVSAKYDYTYIRIKSGNYGWLFFILVIIIAAGVGYYFWNKKRNDKIEDTNSDISENIFSKSNKASNSDNNSSNSEYF